MIAARCFVKTPVVAKMALSYGKKTYADGTYEGQFNSNGLPHGEGFRTFNNSTTYRGSYKNKAEHGDGVLTFMDGTSWKGQFAQYYPCALGVWCFADGVEVHGEGPKPGFSKGASVAPTEWHEAADAVRRGVVPPAEKDNGGVDAAADSKSHEASTSAIPAASEGACAAGGDDGSDVPTQQIEVSFAARVYGSDVDEGLRNLAAPSPPPRPPPPAPKPAPAPTPAPTPTPAPALGQSFAYAALATATSQFAAANVIGEGAFSVVYRCRMVR